MPLINVHDLAYLLEKKGYHVDDDDGEVFINYDPDEENIDNLLIVLAAIGALKVKHDTHENQVGFYLPNWKCYGSMEAYCEEFPNDPACKTYDT
tara:strand:+ start:306 stop:587 length:282 start_codon:yes stop_codon:yes gene_type:complete